MKKKTLIAVILLIAMLLSAVACTGKSGKQEPTTQPDGQNRSDDGYDYGKLNCGGAEFTFLQCDEDRWGMKTALAPDGLNGEEISDAMYRRNMEVQDLYNVIIMCVNKDIYETGEFVRQQCLTGGNTVDVAYVIGSSVSMLIGEQLLNDFSETPNVQIYEPWWNQRIREDSQFSGSSSLYYTQSDISVTAFEATWSICFNVDMVSRLHLENPYDLVRNNQWTIEKMFEMATDGMKPNSTDGSFTYSEDTDCIVGFATYSNFTAAGLNGAGCFMTKKDEIGNPMFSGEGEKFLDVVEKYAKTFHTPGQSIEANLEGFHYEEIFAAQRALFAGVEIKATSKFRQKQINYGIIPVPKYDEEQETYFSNVTYLAPVLVIPNTNTEAEKTGRILDTLAYKSYKDILPVYYEKNLAYKAIGTPEGFEMLNIIRDSRCFETSLLFGWTTDFYAELTDVFSGYTPYTSASNAIGSYRSKIIATINDYISSLG